MPGHPTALSVPARSGPALAAGLALALAAALASAAAGAPGPASTGARDRTLAEVQDFTERFNRTYERGRGGVPDLHQDAPPRRQRHGELAPGNGRPVQAQRSLAGCAPARLPCPRGKMIVRPRAPSIAPYGSVGFSRPRTSPVSASRKATRSALSWSVR